MGAIFLNKEATQAPLISLLVPIYNVASYVDRCVGSLVNQTYSNLEILLVDDGSTDGSGALCDEWAKKDSRIHVVHKENGGLSDARNAGIKRAAGAYLAFIDGDDYIAPEYCEKLYQTLAAHDTDISLCNICYEWADGRRKDYEPPHGTREGVCTDKEVLQVLHGVGDLTLCVAWNKLYKRIIFTGNPPLFFPKGRYYEDEFLNYKLLNRASRIAVIPDALYFYFQRDGSIIHQYSDKHFTDLICCIENSLTWHPDDAEKRQWKLRHSLKLCFTLYKKCHDDLHFRNRISEVKGLVSRIMKELKITYLTKRELVKVLLILVGGYGPLYQVKCRLKASL